MISNLSNKVLNFLLEQKVIQDTEYETEYYKYGIEITISSILNIVIIIALGIILGVLKESIIFLICFIVLRQFTGGYHADSYLKCNMYFALSFISLILIYKMTSTILTTFICILISFACIVLITTYCPIEHINKPLSHHKKVFNRIIAIIISLIYSFIGTYLVSNFNCFGAILIYTLLLITILIILSFRKEKLL